MSTIPSDLTPDVRAFHASLLTAVERSYGTALNLCRNPADAEDLLQGAAVLALRGRASFQPGSNFRAWFYRILVNHFYTEFRRRRREGAVVELDESFPETGAGPDFAATNDLSLEVLERIDGEAVAEQLRALPEALRVVAVLYFNEDLPYQAIADALDIPIGTVRSRLHRARLQLREGLRELAASRGIGAGPAWRPLFSFGAPGSRCREALSRLDTYLDNELSAADCGLIEAHLATCKSCRHKMEAEAVLFDALKRKLARIPCPPEVRDRIMRHITEAMAGE